jgi:hypothetical protein
MLRLEAGDLAGSREDLEAAHGLAAKFAGGPSLVHNLAGLSMEALVQQAVCEAVVAGPRTKPELKMLLHVSDQVDQIPGPARAVDTMERLVLIEIVQRIAFDQPIPPIVVGNPFDPQVDPVRFPRIGSAREQIDWDAVLRQVNREFDLLADAMKLRDIAALQYKALVEVDWRHAGRRRRVAAEPELDAAPTAQWVSDKLMIVLLPALTKVATLHHRMHLEAELNQVMIALELHHLAHGRYPEALSALAPAYLSAVPPDRYAGRPLRYAVTERGYRLYSVYEDGVDDGGRTLDDFDGGDLGIDYERPAGAR